MGGALFYFLLKEPAMRAKFIFLVLIVPLFLIACQGQSTPTTLPTQVTPSITGLEVTLVDSTTSRTIQQRMGAFIASSPYIRFESGGQLLLYLVSSGKFDQAEFTLEDGTTYQADVLYAYTMMASQRVVVTPVLIGLLLPNGGYLYFSQNYAFQSNSGIFSMDFDQQTALRDARGRLPRGRIFRLLAYGMATPHGLDWDRCPSLALYPQAICPIGELVEQLYPGQTKSFVLRLSDGFPANWLLIGWVFQEFAPEELIQGASINVPLP
jgi:hypothetical protein